MRRTRILLLSFFCCYNVYCFAQKISGRVTGENNRPLGFASVVIKESGKGVSANSQGYFDIPVAAGTYTLSVQYVGYKNTEKQVTVDSAGIVANVHLHILAYTLDSVVVKSGGEDPAYEIIRKAIARRADYARELQKYQCELYIKGQLRLRGYPRKFLGNPIEFPDGDTSQKRIIFLSETIARYSVERPDNVKTEVLSTKVSGNSDAFGLSTPQIISFYDNIVQIGSNNNLNPRGFISPIADNALKHYRYKLQGTYMDNGNLINHIQITPLKNFDPAFGGYIDIIEDSWRIYSVDAQLLKKQQMQLLDTLKVQQLYMPKDSIWIMRQQLLQPAVKIFGFNIAGNFLQVYRNYNLNPNFNNKFFDNTILKFNDSALAKSNAYWNSVRPIELMPDEKRDYRLQDSIEVLRRNPHYLDSIDRAGNKVSWTGILLGGETFTRERRSVVIKTEPLLNIINYNTVEGAVINISPEYDRAFGGRKSLYVSPNIRYGFNNHHFNAHVSGTYNFGSKFLNILSFSGGKRVFQFDANQPISERANTIVSLLSRKNFMKIYEASYLSGGYTKEYGNGFSFNVNAEFQHRMPLENTTYFSLFKKNQNTFTPNYPTELVNSNIPTHNATMASLTLNYQPKAKYIEYPFKKINVGSKYPMFTATLTQGINKLFGSDVNYSKWSLSAYNNMDLKLAGRFIYRASLSGFFNNNKTYVPDYTHFIGGSTSLFASEFLNSFQLMPFYKYSTDNDFYSTAHVEYHLNGIAGRNIPYFKKLNWFFVVGANTLYANSHNQYYEYFLAIENILKIVRVDFVQTYEPNGHNTSGIKLSFSGYFISTKQD